MPYAFLNKKVFSCLLKTDSVRLMSRSPRGSEFQKDGPETANILEPYPRVLVRGMTKSAELVSDVVSRWGRTSFSAWSGVQLHAKLIVAWPPEICRLPPGDCCSSRSCWWWRLGPESSRSPLTTSPGSISIAGDDSMPSCIHVVRDLSWKAGSRSSHQDRSRSSENLPCMRRGWWRL